MSTKTYGVFHKTRVLPPLLVLPRPALLFRRLALLLLLRLLAAEHVRQAAAGGRVLGATIAVVEVFPSPFFLVVEMHFSCRGRICRVS